MRTVQVKHYEVLAVLAGKVRGEDRVRVLWHGDWDGLCDGPGLLDRDEADTRRGGGMEGERLHGFTSRTSHVTDSSADSDHSTWYWSRASSSASSGVSARTSTWSQKSRVSRTRMTKVRGVGTGM